MSGQTKYAIAIQWNSIQGREKSGGEGDLGEDLKQPELYGE